MLARFTWFRTLGLLLLLACVGALAVQVEGCTALGFTLGAFIDMENGKDSPERLVRVKPGTRITLWTADGGKHDGRFAGLTGADDSLLVGPQPPLPDGARIRIDGDLLQQSFRADSVTRISVPVVRGKVIGTLVGVAADVIILAVVVEAAYAESYNSTGCGSTSVGPY